MLPIHFLKKYFPHGRDWLIGGIVCVVILWLVALPIEIYNISMHQKYYCPDTDLGFVVKSLYLKGFLLSASWAPDIIQRSFDDQTATSVIMLLGVLISSPGYFLTGALLATRKTIGFGILLLAINVIANCYLFFGLAFLCSG